MDNLLSGYQQREAKSRDVANGGVSLGSVLMKKRFTINGSYPIQNPLR